MEGSLDAAGVMEFVSCYAREGLVTGAGLALPEENHVKATAALLQVSEMSAANITCYARAVAFARRATLVTDACSLLQSGACQVSLIALRTDYPICTYSRVVSGLVFGCKMQATSHCLSFLSGQAARKMVAASMLEVD